MQLIVHGHFYQPPREDPFTGRVPRELTAAPYHDWNRRILAECYAPNVALGNFGRGSFDLGPTLAAWLRRHSRATWRGIRRQQRGNALAQAYNHTILPLAQRRDKWTQVRWGILEFERSFGVRPRGMWLPETAVDLETLEVLAEQGIEFTILAPWQAAPADVDSRRGYRVRLGGGRSIGVLFFDAWLSGSVSFDPWATEDARRFVEVKLAERRSADQPSSSLLLIASDGELYGHHQRGREHFLRLLLECEAPRRGYMPTQPAEYLDQHPPSAEIEVRDRTSWSCMHGVARWSSGCACTEGDSSWKAGLRVALDRLGLALAAAYEDRLRDSLVDVWRARDESIVLRLGTPAPRFLADHARRPLSDQEELVAARLLAAQYYGQAMQVSDAYYWEDVARMEPRNALACAVQAVALTREAGGGDLAPAALRDLAGVRSAAGGCTAARIFEELLARRQRLLDRRG